MIPILFNKDITKIGYMKDCLKCEVTEERNGQYEAVIEYPASGRYFDSITPGAVIKTKPNKNSDNQFFRIYSVSKPINGIITINLQHISYDLSGYPINEVSINANTTAQAAIQQVLLISNSVTPHSFTVGSCSVNVTHPFKVSCCSARAALGGMEGSVLDTYGGEFEFDNYEIKLHKNRGADNRTVIRYGKNMTAMELKLSAESSYTGLFPYVDTDDGRITLSDNNGIINVTNTSGVPEKILILDMSSYFGDSEEKNQTNLLAHANAYLNANDINAVSGSLTVEMLDLSQANHPRSFAALENVNLCDTVRIINQVMGVSASMKVIKTVYDSLGERYTKLELGTPSSSFADTIKQTAASESYKAVKEAQKAVNAGTSHMLNYYNQSLKLLTSAITQGTGGYMVLYPPSNPSELLFMDTDDVNTAHDVMRFNSAGIAHSSSGYNGPYDWGFIKNGKLVINDVTAEKINANLITAGILMSPDGKNYFALDGDSNGHSGGYLKATAGSIGGWTLQNNALYSDYGLYRAYIQNAQAATDDTWIFSTQYKNSNNIYNPRFYASAGGEVYAYKKIETSERFMKTSYKNLHTGLWHYYNDTSDKTVVAKFGVDELSNEFGTAVSLYLSNSSNITDGSYFVKLGIAQADYASDTVVLRTITSTGNPSYINIGQNGVYFQKSYGSYDSNISNMLNLYCRDVYFSNQSLSLVSLYNTVKNWINTIISVVNNHANVISSGSGSVSKITSSWN